MIRESWFPDTTNSIFLLTLLFLLGHCFQKNLRLCHFKIRSGWNLAELFFNLISIDWCSRISDMLSYFQDGGHDIISRQPATHCCICSSVHRLPASPLCVCVCVWRQSLISSTFILDLKKTNMSFCQYLNSVQSQLCITFTAGWGGTYSHWEQGPAEKPSSISNGKLLPIWPQNSASLCRSLSCELEVLCCVPSYCFFICIVSCLLLDE